MKLPRRAIAVLGAALLASCGYTTSSLVPDRYHTISVPVFANETRRHDLEIELTRLVVEELQGRTHLRVVGESDDPDLVLRGVLREVDEETLSRRGFQRPRENVVFVTAEVDVQDRRSQQPLVKDAKVHERESYVAVVGEDVRTARAEATRALAERIVRTLEQTW